VFPDDTSFHLVTISELYEGQLNKLSLYRFENLHKLSKKRRLEFFSGRWCAAQCLQERNSPSLNVKVSSDRAPIWPNAYIGSISHSNLTAVSLVGSILDYSAIGIDLQQKSEYSVAEDLKAIIFHSNELEKFWDNKRHTFSTENFDIIFSAKETLFKALYPKYRHFFDHHCAEVIYINKIKGELKIQLTAGLGNIWKQGQSFMINYQYINGELLTHLLLR
jgi:4'-phosphopantetheinyl transferase EntD